MHHLDKIIALNNPGLTRLRCGAWVKTFDPAHPMRLAMDAAEQHLMYKANRGKTNDNA